MPVLTPLIVIALIHGLTEFLPIARPAHDLPAAFVLARVGFDGAMASISAPQHIAILLGCAVAAALFCLREIGLLIVGIRQIITRRPGAGSRLIGQLLIACLPLPPLAWAILSGHIAIGADAVLIGWVTLAGGVVLFAMDRAALTIRSTEHLSGFSMLFLGLLQAAAVIPGAGRAALVILGGRYLGCERVDSARLAALLGLPWLIGAAAVEAFHLHAAAGRLPLPGIAEGVAFGCAFGAALIGFGAMVAWVREGSFGPFAVYRMLLGAGLVIAAYAGAI